MEQKTIINFKEACEYTSFSKAYMYKLTSCKLIPHYKPCGGNLYFKKSELDEWLTRNRIATASEIAEKANSYCKGKKRV